MSSTLQGDTRLKRDKRDRQSASNSGNVRQPSSRSTSSTGNEWSGIRSLQNPERVGKVAKGLGWFSIGLGVAELVAPDGVARLIGVRPGNTSRTLLRIAGARELSAGLGILARERPTRWVWSRVAGDMMDLSMLGAAMTRNHTEHARLNAATVAVLGVTALDILTGNGLSSQQRGPAAKSRGRTDNAGIRVKRSVTIGRPRQELYTFYHDFRNLPRFMRNVESVVVTGDGRSHWVVKAPGGFSVEWDAEITADQPYDLIAWRSVGKADVDNAGVVRFVDAPGSRGTEVHVDLRYEPPGGALGTAFAKLFGADPGVRVEDDLRRFKQVMEVGEPVLSDASMFDGPHAAQPARRSRRG
jgi:uncharacterized membrane protein